MHEPSLLALLLVHEPSLLALLLISATTPCDKPAKTTRTKPVCGAVMAIVEGVCAVCTAEKQT